MISIDGVMTISEVQYKTLTTEHAVSLVNKEIPNSLVYECRLLCETVPTAGPNSLFGYHKYDFRIEFRATIGE